MYEMKTFSMLCPCCQDMEPQPAEAPRQPDPRAYAQHLANGAALYEIGVDDLPEDSRVKDIRGSVVRPVARLFGWETLNGVAYVGADEA